MGGRRDREDPSAALFAAVDADDPEAVRRAVAGGADVDTRLAEDSTRRTALHLAAHDHRRGAVEALLAAGADVHAADAFGSTPLHYATYPAPDTDPGDGAVAALLLAAGADPAEAAGGHPDHFEGQSVLVPYDDRTVLLRERPDGLLAAFRRPWRETYCPWSPDDWEHVFVALPSDLWTPVTLAWLVGRVPHGSEGEPVQLAAIKLTELPASPPVRADGSTGDMEYDELGPTVPLALADVQAAVAAGRIADPETTALLFALLHEVNTGIW